MPIDESSVEQTTEAATQDSAPVTNTNETTEAPAEGLETETAETTEQPVAETGAEKRIKQLAAQRNAEREAREKAEREAAYYRGAFEAKGQTTAPATPPQAQPNTPPIPPDINNFPTYAEYEVAKDNYIIQVAEYRMEQKQLANSRRNAELTAHQQYLKRIEEAAEADPTILDIANDRTLPVSTAMAAVIQQSEMAPQILKWLGNNRKDASRIATLPPIMAAKEIGVIEATIKTTPKPAPPKRVSAAPAPISTVGATSNSVIDEDDLPMEEYYKRRTKQMFGR
jgi:hypothetical protein